MGGLFFICRLLHRFSPFHPIPIGSFLGLDSSNQIGSLTRLEIEIIRASDQMDFLCLFCILLYLFFFFPKQI